MPTHTEQIAVKLMKAIVREWDREPNLLKCQRLGELAGDVCKSQTDFDKAVEFLFSNRLVEGVHRDDGLAVKPVIPAGIDWIRGQSEKWSLDNRLKILALVVALLGILVTLWLALWKSP